MAKTKETANNEVLVVGTQNLALEAISNNMELFERFEAADDSQLMELTSALLKLEEGEIWHGAITNEIVSMKSSDDGGDDYEGLVAFNKARERVIVSDAVVLGAMKEHFLKNPETPFVYARISCKGMKKSARDAKKEYRDLTVRILG